MKVQELVEFVGKNKVKYVKVDQLKDALKKQLEVKDYMSIKDKKQLVNSIVDDCILYDNGIFKFNGIDKYVCFTMKTIEAYTNLELSEDFEEDYDVLSESKLLETVVDLFKKEYDEVNILLQMRCEYILNDNSLQSQFGRFLTNISDKLDDFAGVLSHTVGNFDMSKLPISEEDLNKLVKFLNTQK